MAKWTMMAKRADFDALAKKHNIDPVTARLIINRDVAEEDFDSYLHPKMSDLLDAHLLKDCDLAVELLCAAIDANKKIRVIGDYDIDGIQSTYILKTGIEKCGGLVDYAIPHRIEDGYGLNSAMIDLAKEDGIEFIITCDNGIAAREAIQKAKDYGMTVVVTDHHEIPYEMKDDKKVELLPLADAIVNPKQSDCAYPFKQLCGAVVAWKVIKVLYEKRGIDEACWEKFIENAAFATIGDIMELSKENRSIVALGLLALGKTKNVGMRALIDACELSGDRISSYHIGFVLGPCLNAAGRLESAALGMELLEEKDEHIAHIKAKELVELNDERKTLTEKGVEQAKELVEKMDLVKNPVLVIYLPDAHESIAGIIAGRIKEAYYRPTIVLCKAKEGGVVKGSARSIPSYNMYEKLHEQDELFIKYGGHPMAAGVSLLEKDIDTLRDRLNESANLTDEDLEERVKIDVPMPLDYITFPLIEELSVLEPFGNGNSKPVFAVKNVPITSIRRIGKNKEYLKLTIETGKGRIDGMLFSNAAEFEEGFIAHYGADAFEALLMSRPTGATITCTYYPSVNVYKDMKSIQIMIDKILF